jgi:hypothetical protein
VFGAGRKTYLAAATAHDHDAASAEAAARRAQITATIDDLRRGQHNLIKELESLQPSGDPGVDQVWRRGIQERFAAAVTDERRHRQLLTELADQPQATAQADTDLLDLLPQAHIDLRRLPDDQQRALYEAFHLELRYNCLTKQLTIRVTVSDAAAQAVARERHPTDPRPQQTETSGPEADASGPDIAVRDALCAPPGTRTPNPLTMDHGYRPVSDDAGSGSAMPLPAKACVIACRSVPGDAGRCR